MLEFLWSADQQGKAYTLLWCKISSVDLEDLLYVWLQEQWNVEVYEVPDHERELFYPGV